MTMSNKDLILGEELTPNVMDILVGTQVDDILEGMDQAELLGMAQNAIYESYYEYIKFTGDTQDWFMEDGTDEEDLKILVAKAKNKHVNRTLSSNEWKK